MVEGGLQGNPLAGKNDPQSEPAISILPTEIASDRGCRANCLTQVILRSPQLRGERRQIAGLSLLATLAIRKRLEISVRRVGHGQ